MVKTSSFGWVTVRSMTSRHHPGCCWHIGPEKHVQSPFNSLHLRWRSKPFLTPLSHSLHSLGSCAWLLFTCSVTFFECEIFATFDHVWARPQPAKATPSEGQACLGRHSRRVSPSVGPAGILVAYGIVEGYWIKGWGQNWRRCEPQTLADRSGQFQMSARPKARISEKFSRLYFWVNKNWLTLSLIPKTNSKICSPFFRILESSLFFVIITQIPITKWPCYLQ